MAAFKYLVFTIPLLTATVLAQVYKDEPPTIKSIHVNTKIVSTNEPSSFVQVLDNGYIEAIVNTIRCTASNAETIKLQYSANAGADGKTYTWGDTLPTILEEEAEQREGEDVTKEVNDGDIWKIEDLVKWNGYYRWYTSTTVGDKTYVTVSPPILLILPSTSGNVQPKSPTGDAMQGKPFRMKCIRDEDSLQPQGLDLRYLKGTLKFNWRKTENGNPADYDQVIASSDGRIKKDPVTGDLYFAYLEAEDAIRDSAAGSTNQLSCNVQVGSDREVTLNDAISWTIQASSEEPKNFEFLAPEVNPAGTSTEATATETKECVVNQKCEVVCLFGGSLGANGTLDIEAPQNSENTNSLITKYDTGFSFLPVADEQERIWKCNLINRNVKIATVNINIKILNYPSIIVSDEFPSTARYVAVGESETKFTCSASYATSNTRDLYHNGVAVSGGNPNIYIENEQQLVFKNPVVDMSGSIFCGVEGSAGYSYASSGLIVYEPATLTQDTEGSIQITEAKDGKNASATVHTLNCNATLDSRTSYAQIYWVYQQKDGEDQRITADTDNAAVKQLTLSDFKEGDKHITSQIIIEYDYDSDKTLRDSAWRCKLEYRVLTSPTYMVDGEKIEFNIEAVTQTVVDPPPWPHWPLVGGVVGGFIFLVLLILLINCYVQKNRGEQYYALQVDPPPEPWPYWPVVGGVVGGIIFLVLVILLINCYVQRNRGEQYYVDEKERKAGHNPEEELAEYGFQDYSRADQNPIKGSRASMNFSDKPMESDTGSLDEYGDIDPGRYNEDGSFINGQYGQKQPSRNQADV